MNRFSKTKYINSCFMTTLYALAVGIMLALLSSPFVVVYRMCGLRGLLITVGVLVGFVLVVGVVNLVKWKASGRFFVSDD